MTEETNLNLPEVKGRLFSVGQIVLATLLGAPLAGCLLLAANYRQLGKSAAAWQAVAAGIVSTIVLMIVSFWLPEKFPGSLLPAVYCVTMRQTVIQLQGGAIDNYLKDGGKGSWAIAVAIGIVSLIVILGIVFGFVMMFDVQ